MPQNRVLNYAAQPSPQPQIVTIQRTSKRWKLNMLLGAVVWFAGLGLIALALGDQLAQFLWVGVGSMVAGITWFWVAVIGAWWENG